MIYLLNRTTFVLLSLPQNSSMERHSYVKAVFAFSTESEFEDHKEVELSHLFMWAN